MKCSFNFSLRSLLFLRWVDCWQVRMFSRLWTAFWRESATSNNSSPPGLRIYLKTTFREVPPPPPPPPRLPLLPPRTHLPTAPPPPPLAPPPPATSTWRCSIRRRRRRRRYRWTARSRRRDRLNRGAGEETWSVKLFKQLYQVLFIKRVIFHKQYKSKW